MSDKPGKTLRMSGATNIEIDGDKFTVLPDGKGLITVWVGEAKGGVVYMFHPLSGWYIEVDMRRDDSTQQESQP